MKIEVTAEDISRANKLISRQAGPASCICPIALAVKRTFGVDSGVSVGNLFVNFADKAIELPDAARTFVFRFDNSFPVSPFSFDLDA